MELTTVYKILYLFGTLLICMVIVYLPRKALRKNITTEFSPRARRMLDLMNFFALGVFLATCFVMLTPHVESTFVSAFVSIGWETETCYKFVQLVIVLGFLFIYFLEKLLDYYKNGHDNNPIPEDFHHFSDVCGTTESGGYAADYAATFRVNKEDDDSNVVLTELNQGEVEQDEQTYEINQNSDMNDKMPDCIVDQSDEEEEEEEEEDGESRRLVVDESAGKLLKPFKRRRKGTVIGQERNVNNNESGCRKSIIGGSQNVPHSIGSMRGHFDVRCAAMLIALCVHSVFEGVTLGLQSQPWHFVGLAGAVTIHQVVAAAAVGVSLTRRCLDHTSFLISSILFSGAIPFGVFVGIVLSSFTAIDRVAEVSGGSGVPRIMSACLQALTVGTFIYVIFLEILPSEFNKRRDRLIKVTLLLLGFVLVSCLAFFLAKS